MITNPSSGMTIEESFGSKSLWLLPVPPVEKNRDCPPMVSESDGSGGEKEKGDAKMSSISVPSVVSIHHEGSAGESALGERS